MKRSFVRARRGALRELVRETDRVRTYVLSASVRKRLSRVTPEPGQNITRALPFFGLGQPLNQRRGHGHRVDTHQPQGWIVVAVIVVRIDGRASVGDRARGVHVKRRGLRLRASCGSDLLRS